MNQITINKIGANYTFQYLDSFGKRSTDIPIPADFIESIDGFFAYVAGLQSPDELIFSFVIENATDEQKLSLVNSYPDYREWRKYKVGDEFRFGTRLYRTIQEHTSQPSWLPNEVPALYHDFSPAEATPEEIEIPEFVKPTGVHDAYELEDMVRFEGKVYRSLISGNTWSPIEYPAGWQLVE